VPQGVRLTTAGRHNYTEQQQERLRQIQSRLTEARRELDALIGDAYLRPRANIVPVHFLDLASATEKLRWAEKEWRELEREIAEHEESDAVVASDQMDDALAEVVHAEGSRR
jgi:predicted translin family RNA/ssDNA-binding protein